MGTASTPTLVMSLPCRFVDGSIDEARPAMRSNTVGLSDSAAGRQAIEAPADRLLFLDASWPTGLHRGLEQIVEADTAGCDHHQGSQHEQREDEEGSGPGQYFDRHGVISLFPP